MNKPRITGFKPVRSRSFKYCGDFCGDLQYISRNVVTSQISLPQLPNRLNPEGLQGFLPSAQLVS